MSVLFAIGLTSVHLVDGVLVYCAGLAVDGDGSPHCYAPLHSGLRGLDTLQNAGCPGNWVGVETDTGEKDGEPVIQGLDDPAPGYYVSATALHDAKLVRTDPRRYVDAENVPYVSCPPSFLHRGVQLGDLACVFRDDKQALISGAIVADVGPATRIGEGSIALAERLEVPSSPRNGGCPHGIVYLLFTGSALSPAWPVDQNVIAEQARKRLAAWGGLGRLATVWS